MNSQYYNDQAHIACEFRDLDEHVSQVARFASFKISSYKLSLVNAAFCITRNELTEILRSTLLNYTPPASILLATDWQPCHN